jgi:tetratricopeptide (TPR) repeat protein
MSAQFDGHKPVHVSRGPILVRHALTYLEADWLRVAILSLAALLIHLPALGGELIWDDNYLAQGNPFIKSPLLALEAFRHYLFLDSFSAHYRPVQNLSFMVDYAFWTDNPYGFHLTNILLHGASGVLLYFLLRRILRPLFRAQLGEGAMSAAAFLVALLWTVHPVHSAAVDYISGRADSLAFGFAAGGWLLFLHARDLKSAWLRILLYLLAAGVGLLALCSRETAGIWLFIFVLHNLFFATGWSRRGKIALLLASVVLFLTYVGLRQLPEHRFSPSADPGWSAPMRSVLVLRALGDYGRLMVWPANLHMERTVVNPDNYKSYTSWQNSIASEYLSVLGLSVAALLILGCYWRGHGQRTRIFGATWFVCGFLPVSNLFNLNATVAEHWLYLPSVGLLLWLAGAALDLPQRMRPMLTAAAGIAVLALSVRSAERSSDWTTTEHFYKRTIAAGGNSARVSLNLGQLYAARGEYSRAEKIFREILRNVPDYPIAKSNLANALYHQARTKEAEALFASAAANATQDRHEFPRTWLAAVNLAGIRLANNDAKGALAILEKARADYPDVWEIVGRESEVLRQTKGPWAAFQLVADFSRDHWWHYGARLALGRLYAEAGDAEHAVQALRAASCLDIHEVDALNLIARVRMRQHRFNDAYRAQKRAVARQPDAPRQYILLSDILEKMGQTAAAKDAIAEVARLEAVGRASHALAN